MATKTIRVRDAVEINYLTDERLYLVTAFDPFEQEMVVLLNISDDPVLARAEVEFQGYLNPEFTPLEKFFEELNEEDIDTF